MRKTVLAVPTALCAILSATWVGAPEGFAQIVPGHDLASFVSCLNGELRRTPTTDVSKTVPCLPVGCKLTLTMSRESAQPACTTTVGSPATLIQLPRILLSCPGPNGNSSWMRFRPSYLLCPTESGLAKAQPNAWNRVEVGSDQTPTLVNNQAAISMQMADITIPFNQAWTVVNDPSTFLSPACNQCHKAVPVQGAAQPNSLILDAFGVVLSKQGPRNGTMVSLPPFVIDTTEPTKKQILVQTPPAPNVTRAAIGAICTQFTRQQVPNVNAALCNALESYQTNSSCGGSQTNAVCGGINGGGMFKNDNPVGGDNSISVISFDVSGQAQRGPPVPNTVGYTFLDTEGNLTAYNYQSRKMITSVKIAPASSLVLLRTGNNYTVVGLADAQVSTGGAAAQPMTVQFSITQTARGQTFTITDATPQANFLAGGTAQPGANVVFLNFAN